MANTAIIDFSLELEGEGQYLLVGEMHHLSTVILLCYALLEP